MESACKNGFFLRANTGSLTKYSGLLDNQEAISLLAGEPLLSNYGIEKDHESLIFALATFDFNIIKSARGVFCAARFTKMDPLCLDLCSDKLGVRPLYYWTDGKFVAFSTLLKVLEQLSIIRPIKDEFAISEIIAFGFPLGNRTKFKNIKIVREAEVVKFTLEKSKSISYWRWDQIKPRNIDIHQASIEAYKIFKESIRIRLHGNSSAAAYLSGGMDSRAILGTMKDLNVKTQAINFSPNKSLDEVIAFIFAKKIGFQLISIKWDNNAYANYRVHLARQVGKLIDKNKLTAERPRSIWSGDGGSVSVGCVYLDREIAEVMRSGDIIRSIRMFRKKHRQELPTKALKKKKKFLNGYLDKAMMQEIERLECLDPAQSLFLFLMYNDQRRHLNDFYEDIDMHNIEYQLPFFDSKFLEFIFSLPLDYRLNHHFYNQWFNVFPSFVIEVPWQTYPGHVPCILPVPRKWKYQWEKGKYDFRDKIRKTIFTGKMGLKIAFFSPNIGPISRPKFILATILHLLCVRDYDYLIKAAKCYANT